MKFNTQSNAPRTIVPAGLLEHNGWRVKVYGFGYPQEGARDELIESGKSWVRSLIDDGVTDKEHYSVGFLGLHDGNGYCQLFFDYWADQNELFHLIKLAKKDTPDVLFDPPEGHNTACVYDAAVQWHEREAWVNRVLRNPTGSDIETYLSDFLEGPV